MVEVLARLARLTGESAYEGRARALVAAFAGEVERNFFPLATYLNANAFLMNVLEVVIVGDREAADTKAMIAAALGVSLPDRLLQVVAPDQALPETHPAFGKTQQQGRATAFLCRHNTCGLPITEPGALAAALATRLGA
jgi:uncharacterized protein YyaL (SSP411 family)